MAPQVWTALGLLLQGAAGSGIKVQVLSLCFLNAAPSASRPLPGLCTRQHVVELAACVGISCPLPGCSLDQHTCSIHVVLQEKERSNRDGSGVMSGGGLALACNGSEQSRMRSRILESHYKRRPDASQCLALRIAYPIIQGACQQLLGPSTEWTSHGALTARTGREHCCRAIRS